jgi:hypothetical protein
MKVNTKIPVRFENVENYDSRFQKVKIWLMHLGKNYNRSVFDKDVVEQAFDSLKNTPILGYIEESKFGDKDFRGHEMELVVEDGEIKTKYIGQAFGVIPENCNPRFEQKEGDTGELLDYLVVDGLLWTKFDDAISIINEQGEVNQSMELHDEYDGSWDEQGYFHFSKFKFYGACMLGQDVLPAMQKASVEKVFSTNVIQDEITRKLEEFSQLVNQNNFKEVEHVTLEELLAKYSLTVEALAEKGINVEEYSVEDLEAKIQEFSTEDNQEDGQVEDGEVVSTEMGKEDGEEDEGSEEGQEDNSDETEFSKEDGQEDSTVVEDSTPEKFQLNFELSHDDIRSKMYETLDTTINQANSTEDWYYIVSIYESYIVAENGWGDKFYMVDYTKDGDNITLGSVSEVFAMFLTKEEKGALELMRSNFEAYEKENQELKEFKATVEKQSHEAEAEELFAQFGKLSNDDLAEIRENVHNFSISEIESKLYELIGRKTAQFSREPKSPSLKVGLEPQERTSTVDSLFSKHGIRK